MPAFLYFKIYLTRLSPENFYGTVKLQKLPNNGTVDQLPLRPIIFNIGVATYDLAKYLVQLKPSGHRNILSRMVNHWWKGSRTWRFLLNTKMVSFDAVSLFTKAPLDETIEIIIKRIYNKKEINTDIPNKEMRKLLCLCTKNAHFTLSYKASTQLDVVAMTHL